MLLTKLMPHLCTLISKLFISFLSDFTSFVRFKEIPYCRLKQVYLFYSAFLFENDGKHKISGDYFVRNWRWDALKPLRRLPIHKITLITFHCRPRISLRTANLPCRFLITRMSTFFS